MTIILTITVLVILLWVGLVWLVLAALARAGRHRRIADLVHEQRAAQERGDVAAADQAEAELRNLRTQRRGRVRHVGAGGRHGRNSEFDQQS